jgi:hypothetical protein
MEILDTFFALKNFVKGNISGYELTGMDPNIRDVRVNSNNLGQSIIYLDFDDEDKFFKLMEMDENDVWFLRNINSHYSDYNMIDWYTVKENFLEGYDVFVSFDEDNIEKLKQISKLIYNRNFNLDDDEFRKGLAHKMYDNFNHPTQDILNEFHSEKNSEMLTTARNSINQEIENYFKRFDFNFVPYDGVKTTVGNLIMWYIRTNSFHLPIKGVLTKIFEDNKPNFGGWYENSYEYQDSDNFDDVSFNRGVSRSLDKILDTITDDFEREGFDLDSYLKMTERILNKFNFERWYALPKKKDVRFRVEGFEKNPNRIHVRLSKEMKARDLKLSEENFYHLLYQPTLFNFDEI